MKSTLKGNIIKAINPGGTERWFKTNTEDKEILPNGLILVVFCFGGYI